MVRIEPAKVEDVSEIKQVLSETWRATYQSFLSQATIDKVTSVWHNPKQLAREIQDPRIYFGVARSDTGAIIGLTTLGKMSDELVEANNQSAYMFYQHHGFRETDSKEERVEGDVIQVKVMEKVNG